MSTVVSETDIKETVDVYRFVSKQSVELSNRMATIRIHQADVSYTHAEIGGGW